MRIVTVLGFEGCPEICAVAPGCSYSGSPFKVLFS